MSRSDFRIFLSAVTSEFGKARDSLAADLRSRNLLVSVQSDFRQEASADTTVRKLHDYIRDCRAVVCLIGKRSGACPPPAAAEAFVHMLPSGISEASYTHWEFFFARHYRRRLSIYIANEGYDPDEGSPTSKDAPHSQEAFVRHIIEEQGLDRSYFSNTDQLCRAVLKEDWNKPLYDFHLSHSQADGQRAAALVQRLRRDHGFSVWSDPWDFYPDGRRRQRSPQGLESAGCCGICVSNTTPAAWVNERLQSALNFQLENDWFGVIPIVFPNTTPDFAPDFGPLRRWADFRIGKDQNYAFHVLAHGIRGEPASLPPAESNEAAWTIYERKILDLHRFRSLGVHEKVILYFEKKTLTEWFKAGG